MSSDEQARQNNDSFEQNSANKKRSSVKELDDQTAPASIIKYFKLSKNFEETKKYLSKIGNYYINSLFSVLGYQYKGRVEYPNIFHISAEAWLLGVFNELRRDETFDDKNFKCSYFDLLAKMKEIIVEENIFIDNMKLLTGIYGMQEEAFNDTRIFKIFLVTIQETKNQISLEGQETMDKKDFEALMLRLLRSAFNYALNEFNSQEEDKKNLDLLNLYMEIEAIQKEVLFDRFVKVVYEKKDIREGSLQVEEERKLNLHLTYFYHFSQTTFEDLLTEIDLFNQNAGSVVFKIRNLISLKNMKRMYIKYFDLMANTLESGLRNMKLESVINFYKSVAEKIKPIKDQTENYIATKYTTGKQWITSSVEKFEDFYKPFLHNVSTYSSLLYEKTSKMTEVPRVLFYSNVYQPLSNLTLKVTSTSIDIFVNTVDYSRNKVTAIRNAITERVTYLYSSTKNSLFGEDPLLKVEYNSEKKEYMTISISKKLFILDPQRAQDFLRNILETVKSFSLKETGVKAYNYTKEKVDSAKAYIMATYKKFLELASEEEIEAEDNKHVKSE